MKWRKQGVVKGEEMEDCEKEKWRVVKKRER